MDYQFPLTAVNRDGTTRVFNNVETFRAFAFDRANGGVGGYWLEGYGFGFGTARKLHRVYEESRIHERWFSGGAKNTWIVRDDRGRVVDKEDFIVRPTGNFTSDGKWSRYFRRREIAQVHAAENNLPIPGTGKRRCHRKSASIKGRNGAHNQRKGIKLFEDPLIASGNFDDL